MRNLNVQDFLPPSALDRQRFESVESHRREIGKRDIPQVCPQSKEVISAPEAVETSVRAYEGSVIRASVSVTSAHPSVFCSSGQAVECNYWGKGVWRSSRVIRVHSDGAVDIDFPDGVRQLHVPLYWLRVAAGCRPFAPPPVPCDHVLDKKIDLSDEEAAEKDEETSAHRTTSADCDVNIPHLLSDVEPTTSIASSPAESATKSAHREHTQSEGRTQLATSTTAGKLQILPSCTAAEDPPVLDAPGLVSDESESEKFGDSDLDIPDLETDSEDEGAAGITSSNANASAANSPSIATVAPAKPAAATPIRIASGEADVVGAGEASCVESDVSDGEATVKTSPATAARRKSLQLQRRSGSHHCIQREAAVVVAVDRDFPEGSALDDQVSDLEQGLEVSGTNSGVSQTNELLSVRAPLQQQSGMLSTNSLKKKRQAARRRAQSTTAPGTPVVAISAIANSATFVPVSDQGSITTPVTVKRRSEPRPRPGNAERACSSRAGSLARVAGTCAASLPTAPLPLLLLSLFPLMAPWMPWLHQYQ